MFGILMNNIKKNRKLLIFEKMTLTSGSRKKSLVVIGTFFSFGNGFFNEELTFYPAPIK